MKLQRQIKLWMILASVIPCTIIIVAGLCHLMGWNLFQQTAIVSGVVIISVLVVSWWWWAMSTLNTMTKDRSNSLEVMQRWFNIRNQRLVRLEAEIKKLQQLLKESR